MNCYRVICLILLVLCASCESNIAKKVKAAEIADLYDKGDLDDAANKADEYLRKDASNEYVWTILGNIRSDQDSDSLAIRAYQKALDVNPDFVQALTGMGIIYRKRRAYDKALELYNQAISIDPNYAEAYTSILVIYLKKKHFKQAIATGVKACQMDGDNPIFPANLSIAYHYIGDTITRNSYFESAKKKGYSIKKLNQIQKIFSGELTIFDEEMVTETVE